MKIYWQRVFLGEGQDAVNIRVELHCGQGNRWIHVIAEEQGENPSQGNNPPPDILIAELNFDELVSDGD